MKADNVFVTQPPPLNPGLSAQQLQELADARGRAKKIRRAVSVATFNGWATAIFGGLTFLGALSGSIVAGVLGGGMLIVAWVEFKGAKRLRELDPAAAKSLACNQVFFGALLLGYAAYSLWQMYADPKALMGSLSSDPEVMEQFGSDMVKMTQLIGWLLYGTLAAVAVFGQGGTALYYLSRRKLIEQYLTQTPAWIVQAQRAGMSM